MAAAPRPRPPRFDALARALWGRAGGATASRRGVVWGLVGLAAGGLLPRGGVARALDTGPEAEPALDTGPAEGCPTPAPAPAPAAPVGAEALRPRPARIHAGTCLDLGDPVLELLPVGNGGTTALATPAAGGNVVGAASAVPGQMSVTLLDVALADLYGQARAIAVLADEGGEVIACGDIGGRLERQVAGEELVLGLPERGASGFSGIAWLRSEADRTLAHVFLAPGLGGGGLVGAPMVVVNDDVNVRSSPTTDAAVVGVLPRGARVTATGAAFAGWIPITDPATGVSGYVLAEFLQAE